MVGVVGNFVDSAVVDDSPAGDAVALVASGVIVVDGSSDEIVIDGSSLLVDELLEYFYHLLEPVCVVGRYVVAAADGNFVVSADYFAADSVEVGDVGKFAVSVEFDNLPDGDVVALVVAGVIVVDGNSGVIVIGGSSLLLLNVPVV